MSGIGNGLHKNEMSLQKSCKDHFSKSFAQHHWTKQFFCLICKFVSKTVEQIKMHFQVNHCTSAESALLVKASKCPYCDLKLAGSVSRHIKNVHLHQKEFVCKTCQKEFGYNRSLQMHKCINTLINSRSPLAITELNYSSCSFRLIENTDLPSKSEPYHATNTTSSVKSDRQTENLIYHNFVVKVCNAKDQSEETFKCSLCDFKAKYRNFFYIHLIECYSGQSLQNCSKVTKFPFKCKVCEHHLQGKDNFSRHVRIVHEQISLTTCFSCCRAFNDSRSKNLHLGVPP